MASARICSTWSRVLGKGVCSRYGRSTCVFVAVLRVADNRFTADAYIMGSMMQPQRQKEEMEDKERGEARAIETDWGKGESEEDHTLWGMMYADDADVASPSPGGLEKILTVIVTACGAFGLTVSEAKTESMSANGIWGGHVVQRHFGRPGVQTHNRLCVLGLGYQH